MLDRLPYCLLQSLPGYVHTLPDLRSLILTSSILHTCCGFPTPQQLLRLAISPETHLQPYPHLLLAVKARALSAHSVKSARNLAQLHIAIKNGPEAVLNLALKISPLRKEDLQNLHEARQVIDELADIMEPECGPSSEENEMITVCNNVSLALINYWIYCELFSKTIEAQYRELATPVLPSLGMRQNWFLFCVPDENSRAFRRSPYVGDIDYSPVCRHLPLGRVRLPTYITGQREEDRHHDMDAADDDDHEAYGYQNSESKENQALLMARREFQSLDLMCLVQCLDDMFHHSLNVILPNPPDGTVDEARVTDTHNIVRHLGIDSLRLLLDAACSQIPESVKEVIATGERGEIKSPNEWMDHHGWRSFRRDLTGSMGWA